MMQNLGCEIHTFGRTVQVFKILKAVLWKITKEQQVN